MRVQLPKSMIFTNVVLFLGAVLLMLPIARVIAADNHSGIKNFFEKPSLLTVTTLTVNSIGDSSDANPGNGVCNDGTGACTLRAAIEEVNGSFQTNAIEFNIPGAGVHTIAPQSALPTIQGSLVSIDGYTQPGE